MLKEGRDENPRPVPEPRRAAAEIIGEQLRLARQHRYDREPAMPDDLGGDALARFALRLGIDWQHEIGVGLDVDKPRETTSPRASITW